MTKSHKSKAEILARKQRADAKLAARTVRAVPVIVMKKAMKVVKKPMKAMKVVAPRKRGRK